MEQRDKISTYYIYNANILSIKMNRFRSTHLQRVAETLIFRLLNRGLPVFGGKRSRRNMTTHLIYSKRPRKFAFVSAGQDSLAGLTWACALPPLVLKWSDAYIYLPRTVSVCNT